MSVGSQEQGLEERSLRREGPLDWRALTTGLQEGPTLLPFSRGVPRYAGCKPRPAVSRSVPSAKIPGRSHVNTAVNRQVKRDSDFSPRQR